MKIICRFWGFLLGLLVYTSIHSQALLPDFSVRELTRGKIQISWNNPYRNCIQLAIQRSTDSSKNFRTIFSAQSPELASSGYVDNKAVWGVKNWYRIFYVLEGGSYFFTKAIGIEIMPAILSAQDKGATVSSGDLSVTNISGGKDMTTIFIKNDRVFRLNKLEYNRFKDSINRKTKDKLRRIDEHSVEWIPLLQAGKEDMVNIYSKYTLLASLTRSQYRRFTDSIKTTTKDTLYAIGKSRVQLHPYVEQTKKYIFIYRNDSLLLTIDPYQYKKFKDSVSTRTKDTLFVLDNQHIAIHSFVPKYVWKPSRYVFTNSRGYVTILLPEVKQHKYQLIFYEEDGSELFRIKSIKEPELILDKTDFVHAGWFFFELFEDDKLKEKSKLLLQRN